MEKENNLAPEPIKRVRRWGNQFQKIFTDNEIEKIGDELFEWMAEHAPQGEIGNFWIKDFCINKMLTQQCISEFATKNEYFAWLLLLVKDMQESRVVRLGLSRSINPGLPIFILKQMGWRDIIFSEVLQTKKQELTHEELVEKAKEMGFIKRSIRINGTPKRDGHPKTT
mgnify:FL=1